MDLTQTKLTKAEWDSVERPIAASERDILQLIIDGYDDPQVARNDTPALLTFLKVSPSPKMIDYLYARYLKPEVDALATKYALPGLKSKAVGAAPKIKAADLIRIDKNSAASLKENTIFEYVLLGHAAKLLKYFKKGASDSAAADQFAHHYFTLRKLLDVRLAHVNRHVTTACEFVLDARESAVSVLDIIRLAPNLIEKNVELLRYADMKLYDHQKQIFNICKTARGEPKLILYAAPTGTGKTITPVALAAHHPIVFVCAARHVGLALARAAISMERKIAFAFGCKSADDIRLHYYAAKDFTRHRRTGGIFKVDNSAGELVEIMICDIASYLPAMYYMRAFNRPEDIILYWDEPTISLDYDADKARDLVEYWDTVDVSTDPEKGHRTPELHAIIHDNWTKNLLHTVILSSATLPESSDLPEMISDFEHRFPGATVHRVKSHDSKKSIPLIDRHGMAVLPHHLADDYAALQTVAAHCLDNLTLMRYFDLGEVVRFVQMVVARFGLDRRPEEGATELEGAVAVAPRSPIPPTLNVHRAFGDLSDISMASIKLYYLALLRAIPADAWPDLVDQIAARRAPKLPVNRYVDEAGDALRPAIHADRIAAAAATPGLYITTKDAFSLTDGPAIYITDDIEKISNFYIRQANIPSSAMSVITAKLDHNAAVNDKIAKLTNELEAEIEKCEQKTTSTTQCSNKINRESNDDSATTRANVAALTNAINGLSATIKSTILNETFIPNKPSHKDRWAAKMDTAASFTSDIDEKTVSDIMLLNGVDHSWKVMLMMGIGVFVRHDNVAYTEIMKRLADSQRLFMIIASSDYIYGTNYQLCHAYIGKDMCLTQEKLIQAMGRIGRGNVQQDYTIRFRNSDHIAQVFSPNHNKVEADNMNRLFSV